MAWYSNAQSSERLLHSEKTAGILAEVLLVRAVGAVLSPHRFVTAKVSAWERITLPRIFLVESTIDCQSLR